MLKDYIGRDRKYRLRPWVRYVAGAMAAIIAACSIGVIPKVPQEVEATEEVAQVKNVNLGTLGIGDPVQTDSADDPWTGSFVYFGQYDGKPIKFRVLDASTQEFNAEGDSESFTMFLDSDNVLCDGTMVQVPSGSDEYFLDWTWAESYMKTYLNSENSNGYDLRKTGLLTTAFSSIERKAIANSVKAKPSAGDYRDGMYYYAPLTGEKLFLLDLRDVTRKSYGYTTNIGDAVSRKKLALGGNYKGYYAYWLTRQWQPSTDMVKVVSSKGAASGFMSSYGERGVSPALNLDLSSVFFTSVSNIAKADSLMATTDVTNNSEWNLTLKDSDGFVATRVGSEKKVKAGDSVTISVINIPKLSDGSEYTQISAMLTDNAGTIIAYGKIGEAEVKDIQVTIPSDIPDGEYTMKVFAEQVNSTATSNLTDYASNSIDVLEFEIITSVAIENVADPKIGEILDLSATCDTLGVVSTQLSWTYDGIDASGVAERDKVYTAYIVLTATEGRKFLGNVTATVNGNPATSVVVNNDGTLTVGYTFKATQNEDAKLEVVAPVFDEVFGYVENQKAKPVIMTNVGDEDVVINSVTIDDSSVLQLVGDETSVIIGPGQSVAVWSIQPVDHPSVGSHKATVTVTYNNDKTATADVEYVVSKKEIKLVEAWDIAPPTAGHWLDTTGYCVLQGGDGINDTSPWVYWINLETNQEILGERVTAGFDTRYQVVIRTVYNEAYYYVTEELQGTVNGNSATSAKRWGAGTLEIRYNFDATEKEKMEKPEITINYRQEALENFVADGNYTINGTAVTVVSGQVPILEEWFGTTLYIVRKGEGIYGDSEPQKLYIPVRPDAPDVVGVDETVYGANDGKIKKTTTDMEYRKVSIVTWTDCTEAEVTNLSPGYYEVRVKATDTSFAGKPAQVEIKTGVQVCDVSVVDGTGDGTYPVGQVITVVADAAPAGKRFKCWSVVYGLAQLGDSRDAETTLVVPQGAVEIKAEYEDLPVVEPPTEEPSTEAPTQEPSTEAPTEEPTTEAPTEEPTTEAPTQEPSTEAPTEEPTTEAPTKEPETETSTEVSTEEATEKETESQPGAGTENESPATGDDMMSFVLLFVLVILSGTLIGLMSIKTVKKN